MNIRFLSQLFLPPRCVGCGKRIDIFEDIPKDSQALCPNCRGEWEREKLEACPTCRVAAIECSCRPLPLDKKYIDCISLIKFGRTESADRLIYSLKKRRVKKNFEFAGSQLARRLLTYLRETNRDITDVIITNVPRKRASIAKFGFDHAELLAKTVAKCTGYSYKRLIRNIGYGKDQKSLSGDEREENVRDAFRPAFKRKKFEADTVVLVDDVVTTGNTAYECIKVLRSVGVKNVVLLSIARAPEKKKLKRKVSKRVKKAKKD